MIVASHLKQSSMYVMSSSYGELAFFSCAAAFHTGEPGLLVASRWKLWPLPLPLPFRAAATAASTAFSAASSAPSSDELSPSASDAPSVAALAMPAATSARISSLVGNRRLAGCPSLPCSARGGSFADGTAAAPFAVSRTTSHRAVFSSLISCSSVSVAPQSAVTTSVGILRRVSLRAFLKLASEMAMTPCFMCGRWSFTNSISSPDDMRTARAIELGASEMPWADGADVPTCCTWICSSAAVSLRDSPSRAASRCARGGGDMAAARESTHLRTAAVTLVMRSIAWIVLRPPVVARLVAVCGIAMADTQISHARDDVQASSAQMKSLSLAKASSLGASISIAAFTASVAVSCHSDANFSASSFERSAAARVGAGAAACCCCSGSASSPLAAAAPPRFLPPFLGDAFLALGRAAGATGSAAGAMKEMMMSSSVARSVWLMLGQ
mmetsp:Transcript_50745/g.156644  ORF Transcript_50745/g.156644 Transcript_50745/m.156644 type:complete len:442 (-) Transcript_50745:16-1341(-)